MIMAKSIENSQNFEAVPFWQSYPVAIESLGAGRSITPEVAAYVASRVGAKWATAGELNPAKGGVWMRVDFIPAKTNLVPYRFERETHFDGMAPSFFEAFSQFGRYLVMRPMTKSEAKGQNVESLRPLAEALDREYGWYTAADPGKSDKLVADLQRTDAALAKLSFNPILYTALGATVGISKSVELRPTSGAKSDADTSTPGIAPQPQPGQTSPAGGEAGGSQRPAGLPATGAEATLVKEGTAAAAALVTYQIQVYSTQRKESADAKAASLVKEGFEANLEQVEIKDRGTWYRIRLQGFKSRADAKAVGDKLVSEKLIKQYWIVPQ
jgi:cell division protein FtsN